MTTLLVIQIIVTLAMIGVILLQKSEGAGLVSNAGNGMFTARGSANLLSRTTAILATIFFANCLTMAHLASKNLKNSSSIIEQEDPMINLKP